MDWINQNSNLKMNLTENFLNFFQYLAIFEVLEFPNFGNLNQKMDFKKTETEFGFSLIFFNLFAFFIYHYFKVPELFIKNGENLQKILVQFDFNS